MKRILTLIALVATLAPAAAQSCISGWGYYMPITINNPNSVPLTNHQVMITINTAGLVAAGHMQTDGDDIRFYESSSCCSVVPYMIESGMNTTTTNIWVKVASIAASGSTTINMFYGNPGAISAQNPAAVFDLYEDFSGPGTHFTLDPCGSGTATQNAGTMTYTWGSSGVWVSDSTFSLTTVYTAEGYVTACSGTWPGLHFLKTTNQRGYGMLYGGSNNPRLSETGAGSGYCQGHNWASTIFSSSSNVGVWSTTWIATGNIIGTYPTTGLITSTSTTHQRDASMKLVIGGISSGSGSMTYDWIRVRKYAAIVPTVSAGSETVPAGNPAAGFLGADQNMCIGQNITLDASTFGFSTYLWSTGSTAGSIIVNAPGTYWVDGTNSLGCTVRDSIILTGYPTPDPGTVSGISTICDGSTTMLSTAGSTGTIDWYQVVGMSYNLIGNGTSVATPSLSPAGTFTFVAVATTSCGADTSANYIVTADPANNAGIVSIVSDICINGSVSMSTSGSSGTVDWYEYDGTNYILATSNSSTFTTPISVAGTFSFVAVAHGTCADDTSVFAVVTVHPMPVAGVSSSNPSGNICAFDTVIFTNTGAGTYDWYVDPGVTGNFSAFGSGNPYNSGAPSNQDVGPYAFYAVVTSAYCPSDTSNTFLVTVNPTPVVSLGSDTTVCSFVMLDAGNAGSTYMWSTSAITQTVIVSTSGTYDVVVTNTFGCTGRDTIAVTINTVTASATASANSVCLNDGAVTLTGSPAGGTFSGPGVSGNTFTPMTAGNGTHTVTYTYTDINGCTATATVSIVVNACVGITELSTTNGFTVYPNPNTGAFTITTVTGFEDVVIEVLDVTGRVVFTQSQSVMNAGSTVAVDLGGEANGMYFVRVTAGGSQTTLPVSIAK